MKIFTNIKPALSIFVVIIAVCFLVKFYFNLSVEEEKCCIPGGIIEDFVPQNSRDVGIGVPTVMQQDILSMRTAFQDVVDADQGMYNVSAMPPFRQASPVREQAIQYAKDVLKRVNRISGRQFQVLDIQSISRESSFDTMDRSLIDR